jgi:hypothetical protein
MIITVRNEMNRISLRMNGEGRVYLTYAEAKYLAQQIQEKLAGGEDIER